MMTCEAVKTYAFVVDDNGRVVGEVGGAKKHAMSEAQFENADDGTFLGKVGEAATQKRAELYLDQLTRAYVAKEGVGYSDAIDAVSDANRRLVRIYEGLPGDAPAVEEAHVSKLSVTEASARLNKLAHTRMNARDETYSTALHAVMDDPQNAELVADYEAMT